MSFYSYAEQARHYREAAWDRGCICPVLPPHIHLIQCPLYAEDWGDLGIELDKTHDADEGRPWL